MKPITIYTDQYDETLVVMLGENIVFKEDVSKLNQIYYIEHLLRAVGFKVKHERLEVEVDEGS